MSDDKQARPSKSDWQREYDATRLRDVPFEVTALVGFDAPLGPKYLTGGATGPEGARIAEATLAEQRKLLAARARQPDAYECREDYDTYGNQLNATEAAGASQTAARRAVGASDRARTPPSAPAFVRRSCY